MFQLHHSKHHATYVNNLNVAEEKLHDAVAKGDVSSVLGLHGALKFNGGGHLNHSIFWQVNHSVFWQICKSLHIILAENHLLGVDVDCATFQNLCPVY